MEKNKIYRRSGFTASLGYEQVKADFTELFQGFRNVTIESIPEDTDNSVNAHTFIYLNAARTIYILIEYDSNLVVRVSAHCGFNDSDTTTWSYIDSRTRSDRIAYSFARTDYGAVFSPLPNIAEARSALSDGLLQIFFSVFKDESGREVNGLLYSCMARDEVSSQATGSFLLTEDHTALEMCEFTKCFLGSTANQTVLVNAASYSKPLVSDHLYMKTQSEENKFGRIRIGSREFISGSHFCLECGDD